MSDDRRTSATPRHDGDDAESPRGPIEEHAGGEIRSYRGIVNAWLLAVYAILAGWGLYYVFRYWGGLGPGLAR